MKKTMLIAFTGLATIATAACGGDDPVSYSEPVSINLKAKSGDVKNGVIEDEKGITTETSNPYGTFIKNARIALNGADPSRIELIGVALSLGAKSKGVAALESVFNGTVELLFIVDDTKNTLKAAHIDKPTGSGPLEMALDFAWQDAGSTDRAKIISGGFKLVSRGPVVTDFDKAGADADLQFTLRFHAFQ